MTKAELLQATMRTLTMPVTAKVGGPNWTADPEYLRSEAGIWLGRSRNRNFYKENDGITIAVFREGGGEGRWKGPVLVSTDPQAVAYYYNNKHLSYSSVLNHYGLTWYINANHHYETDNDYDTDGLKPWPCPYNMTWPEVAVSILEQAKVRVYAGGFALWP